MTTILSTRLEESNWEETLVENISFDVKQGEVFGFLGPMVPEKRLLSGC